MSVMQFLIFLSFEIWVPAFRMSQYGLFRNLFCLEFDIEPSKRMGLAEGGSIGS